MKRDAHAFVQDLNNLMNTYGLVVSYDTHGLRLVEWDAAAVPHRTLCLEHLQDGPFEGELRLSPGKPKADQSSTERMYNPVPLPCPCCEATDEFTTDEAYPTTFSIDVKFDATYIGHELYEYVAGDETILIRCEACGGSFLIDGAAHVTPLDEDEDEDVNCLCHDCGRIAWGRPNTVCPRCKRGSLVKLNMKDPVHA